MNVTHGFQDRLKKTKLPHMAFHELRHGTATSLLAFGVDRMMRLLGREPMAQRTSLRGTAVATLWAVGSWAGAGLQIYALAVSLGADPGPSTAALAIGGYCLAWAVGFVVIVAPAGAV